MPLGKEHLRLWRKYKWVGLLTTVWFAACAFPQASPDNVYWILAMPSPWLGYLLGYYIDPDLDQANITAAEWRAMRDLGILGALLTMWFLPYGMLMTHRSFISHFPVVSTAIRYLWLLFPFLGLYLYLTYNVIPDFWPILAGVFFGLSSADLIHYLADIGLIRDKLK